MLLAHEELFGTGKDFIHIVATIFLLDISL